MDSAVDIVHILYNHPQHLFSHLIGFKMHTKEASYEISYLYISLLYILLTIHGILISLLFPVLSLKVESSNLGHYILGVSLRNINHFPA